MRRAAILLATGLAVVAIAGIVRLRRRGTHETRTASTGPTGPFVIVADGGGPFDARPGGDTTWLACGDARCAIDREVCCVYSFPPDRDPMPPALFSCVAGSWCPPPVIGPKGGTGPPEALRCASAVNCSGDDVCCIRVNHLTISASCVDRDDCAVESEEGEKERQEREPESGGMRAQLCDPRAPPALSGCPAAAPCTSKGAVQWQLPPGFGTCGVADEGPF